ncbi:MAG: helix-turn-helix transcriptional regulator [Emcibacter sp.]|nr:helix-turn-helix transcriptional regulator [Emcibacter sp.]
MKKTLYTDEHCRLIRWLKENRLSQNLTMRELAKKLDTQHTLIGKVEQGERRLDVVEYIRYCEALEISPTEGINILRG